MGLGEGGMMWDVGCLVFSGGREGGEEERERGLTPSMGGD